MFARSRLSVRVRYPKQKGAGLTFLVIDGNQRGGKQQPLFVAMRFALFLVLLVTLASELLAQQPLVWQQRADVGSPGQYEGAAMAFDAHQGVTLMFGGEKSIGGVALGVSTDLWQYNGTVWQQVAVSGLMPAARSGHQLVYDPVDHRVLLFGGDAGGGAFLNDLWAFVFSGPGSGSWVRLTDLPSAGRWGMAMGYDETRGQFLVVGGLKQGTEDAYPSGGGFYGSVKPATRETWIWNRSSWTAGPQSALYNNGPLQDHPDFRILAGPISGSLVHHQQSGQTLLLAEKVFPLANLPVANIYYGAGGTSTYQGDTWTANYGGNVSLPVASVAFTSSIVRTLAVYDPGRQRLVALGAGRDFTVEYNGSAWAETSGDVRGVFGTLPSRARACMAHDALRGTTVFFGGKVGVLDPGDTWELVENPAVPFAITTNFSTTMREPCQGETVTLTAAVSGVGPFSFAWFRDDQPVSVTTVPALVLTNVSPAQTGAYTFQVRDSSGRKLTSLATPVFVHAPPVITGPQERRVIPGESFSLQVVVSSTLPVTYQWYKGGEMIPGANSATYTKAAATTADAGNYVVFVTSRCTTVSSNGARVYTGPVVNQQPAAPTEQNVMEGTVSMSITGDGVGAQVGTYTTGMDTTEHPNRHAPDSPTNPRPLQFTWRHEGVPLVPGPKYTITATALGSNLVVNEPDYEDEGMYDCVVTDASGPAYAKVSARTVLILYPLAPPYLTVLQSRGPAPCRDAGMVYDSRRKRTVLFGGEVYGVNPRGSNANIGLYNSNDTWEWDGQLWVRRNPANRPPPMTQFGITYDSDRGRVVVFGGYKTFPPNYSSGTAQINNDVWEWDGVNWSQIVSTTPSPLARTQASMCYDTVRQEVLMMGGSAFSPNPSDVRATVNALWAWNGTQWSARTGLPTPSNNQAPYVYPNNAFAFDPERGVAVMFSPFFDSENPVWEWDGTQWRRIVPPINLRVQESRVGGAPFYDTVRRRIGLPIMSNNLYPNIANAIPKVVWWNGMEFISGTTSAIDDVTGVVLSSSASTPVASYGGQGDMTAFDSERRCIVWLDMPSFINLGPNYTREMHFSAKVKPVHQPMEVIFSANQTITIRVVGAGRRPLNYQWLKDGQPVLDDTHFNGAATGTLTITGATAADVGSYTVRINNLYNQVTTQSILVKQQDDGIGMVVQGGGLVLSWPGTTGILEAAASPAGPWTPVYGVTPPYSVAMDEERKFFRVRYP